MCPVLLTRTVTSCGRVTIFIDIQQSRVNQVGTIAVLVNAVIRDLGLAREYVGGVVVAVCSG